VIFFFFFLPPLSPFVVERAYFFFFFSSSFSPPPSPPGNGGYMQVGVRRRPLPLFPDGRDSVAAFLVPIFSPFSFLFRGRIRRRMDGLPEHSFPLLLSFCLGGRYRGFVFCLVCTASGRLARPPWPLFSPPFQVWRIRRLSLFALFFPPFFFSGLRRLTAGWRKHIPSYFLGGNDELFFFFFPFASGESVRNCFHFPFPFLFFFLSFPPFFYHGTRG